LCGILNASKGKTVILASEETLLNGDRGSVQVLLVLQGSTSNTLGIASDIMIISDNGVIHSWESGILID
jgi:hypothetical protein